MVSYHQAQEEPLNNTFPHFIYTKRNMCNFGLAWGFWWREDANLNIIIRMRQGRRLTRFFSMQKKRNFYLADAFYAEGLHKRLRRAPDHKIAGCSSALRARLKGDLRIMQEPQDVGPRARSCYFFILRRVKERLLLLSRFGTRIAISALSGLVVTGILHFCKPFCASLRRFSSVDSVAKRVAAAHSS